MKKLLFILLLVWIPVQIGASLQERCREILEHGLKSRDLSDKRIAIRMLPLTGQKKYFRTLSDLFLAGQQAMCREPGFEYWKYECLASLYRMDPQATMKILLENQEYVFKYFDSFKLFGLVGYEKSTLFHKPFYRFSTQMDQGNLSVLRAMYLLAMYAKTSEHRYLKAYRRMVHTIKGIQRMNALLTWALENRLPCAELLIELKMLVGLVYEYRNPRPDYFHYWENILYQALLYRHGVTREVYSSKFEGYASALYTLDGERIMTDKYPDLPATDRARVKKTVHQPVYDVQYAKDSSLWFRILDALAHLYAGAARQNHVDAFFCDYEQLPDTLQRLVAGLVVDSPDSPSQRNIVHSFIQSPSAEIRLVGLQEIMGWRLKTLPNDVVGMLQKAETTLAERIMILEMYGKTGDKEHIAQLVPYLDHPSRSVCLTAAGVILQLNGGRP